MRKRLQSFLLHKQRALTLMLSFGVLSVLGTSTTSAQTYCTPTANNVANYNIGIQNLTIGSITNNTGAPVPANFYNDYTSSFTLKTTPAATIPYSFTVGGGNSTTVGVYIDWNRNGTYETNTNEVVLLTSAVQGGGSISGSFKLPTTCTPAVYRMRVIGDLGNQNQNPCRVGWTGEIEDYSLEIISSPSIDVMASDGNTSNGKLEIGSNTISVEVVNLSPSITVNTYDIGYRLDNGPSHTESLSAQSFAASSGVTKQFSTPLSVPAEGSYTLKVWARNPNGAGSGISSNDTFYKTFYACNPLSGNYTIDASGSGPSNFTTFTAAVDRLVSCGVSGPVHFSVAAGTYNEQIVIPAVDGTSSTNTVTFDGGAGNRLSRILTFNTTNSENRHVVRLEASQYVAFRNLTIRSTGGTYGFAVHIKSGTHHATFANNVIQTADYNTGTGSTNFIPVCISNSNTSYSTQATQVTNIYIDSNITNGGYYNISVYCGSNSGTEEIYVRNNEIGYHYYGGVYARYPDNMHVEYNRVTQKNSTTTGGYGIYMYGIRASGSQTTTVIGNEIIEARQYSFYLSEVDNSGNRAVIANNIGGSGHVNANSYGAYMNGCSNIDVWHNTFNVSNASTNNNSAALYLSNNQGVDVRNNILSVQNVGASSWCLNATTVAQLNDLDYNNYYKVGAGSAGPIINLENTALSGSSMVGNSGFNNNSFNEAPLFTSGTDLRLTNIASSPFGSNTGLTMDVDGDSRCVKFPTIGADASRFIVANNPSIIADDTVFVNSPTRFFNSAAAGEPKGHIWNIDYGTATFTTLHAEYTFTQVGTHDIKLSTEGCDATDTAFKRVVAIVPIDPPTAAFISTENNVDQGYPVQLIDQSTGGASNWVWTITPASGVQFVNGPNVQNPEVIFNQIGSYEVCLVASNVAGQGAQVCKSAYIQVTEANSMCSAKSVSKSATGKVFDNGGKNNPYFNGANCGFLIDPCATSVTLSFSAFTLDVGDYLRVYDGSDNTGTPLHNGAGFTGTIIPTDLTASTGKMYLELITNNSNVLDGFAASWTSVAKAFPAPVAAFRAPDTLYTGTTFTFISNSTGTDATITWDFDNDDIADATGEVAAYTFSAAGTYLVRLQIEDCGGIDGAVKSIVVLAPSAAPTPDFVTDFRTITSGEVVRFYDRSSQAPDAWEWSFSPSSVTYLEGTDSSSQNPVVRFDAIGTYEVSLTAVNNYGQNTLVRAGAVNVVDYCFPGAGLNTDLGITRVTFAGIDNVSLIGPATYTDYTSTVKSAALQKGTKYPITIERSSNNEDMSRKVWIDYNGDGVFGPSEEVASHTADNSLVWVDSIAIPTNVNSGSTRMRIGTSYGITNNSPCGVNPYGEFEDYTITIFENLTRPVITITGQDTVNLEVGSTYSDLGATAVDDLDGVLTPFIITSTNLDLQTVGTYYVRYNVSDNNGNSTEEVRIINVTPDVTPPVMTLIGNNPLTLVLGSQYLEPGANVVDSYDGVIPFSNVNVTGFVNSLAIGQYVLTYTVQDAAGNMTSAQRTINVGDTTIPQIFLKGADTIYIALGDAFNDPGALVVDNNTSNLSYSVDLSVINNQVVGDYLLTYTAVDSSGNIAVPVNRVVAIRDYTAPTLTLLGDTVIMEVHTQYNEPGYLVTDNYDTQVAVNLSGKVDSAKTGLYVLFYEAVDAGNNKSQLLYRIVKVEDTKAPVITLNGDKFLTLCRWEDYTDPGFVVSDNYDLTVEVEVENNLSTAAEGLYSIRYTASDEAGNVAISQERLIRVIACVTGLKDQADKIEITAYPNPTNGALTINFNGNQVDDVELVLINTAGQTFTPQFERAQDGLKLNLIEFKPGIYVMRLKVDGQIINKKISLVK